MPTKNTAAAPNLADAISTAKPANVMIAGCRTLRRGGSETAVRATGEACRNPKNRLYVMSDNTNEKAEKGSQAATYERNTKRDAKHHSPILLTP
jgi:hypothetical protein